MIALSLLKNKKHCTRGGELKMEKLLNHLKQSWLIVAVLFFASCPTFALENNALISNIEILTPGMNRNMTITQDYRYPRDYNQSLLLLIGYGGVSITVSKGDPVGDLLVLTGIGISSAGIIPFLKFGRTSVSLSEAIEIGDERAPYGLLWFSSWLDSPIDDPPYSYSLSLSFASGI